MADSDVGQRWKARVLVALGQLYADNGQGSWTASEIGEIAHMSPHHVGRVCSALIKVGMITEVEPESRGSARRYMLTPGVQPARRPPARVRSFNRERR
jgi:DNA-binding MarR family transcriptional regulator